MNTIQLLGRIRDAAAGISTLNNILLDAGKAPTALEKDMLKRKCNELYELILLVSPEADSTPVTQPPPPEIKQEPVAVEKPAAPEPEPKKEEPLSMESFEIKELELIADHEAEQKMAKTEEKKEMSPQLSFIEPEAHEPVPHDQISLHEKISSGIRKGDLYERVRDARVESLKTAISLNRKIAFVNDLFGENTVEYAKAIEKLNAAEGLNDAMRYLNELKHARAWNNDNELVKELETLIQKRFS